jgi:hypothetical protein
MLYNWLRYLDKKKDSDIMSNVITRKVNRLKAQVNPRIRPPPTSLSLAHAAPCTPLMARFTQH